MVFIDMFNLCTVSFYADPDPVPQASPAAKRGSSEISDAGPCSEPVFPQDQVRTR